MKHIIYSVALVFALCTVSCSDNRDNKNDNDMNDQVQGAPTTTETTVGPVTDNNAEVEDYRARIDAVIADIDTKIEHNKEMKKDEKDKNKKESYENTIKYLQELKDELKDHKDHFDDRAGKGWEEFKAKLNNLFDRNASDDKNNNAN